MLERGGFQVDEAQDGLDALAKIKTNIPDLLIVDYMMPKMDGPDTCRAVRCHDQTAHLPVIVLSARTDDYSAQHSLAAGATLCLQKPLGFRDLVGNVKRLLQSPTFAGSAFATSTD